MEPIKCLHLQLQLEGKESFGGLIRQVEVVPDEDVPLLLIAQLFTGELIVYFDEAMSLRLQKELAAGLNNIEFLNIDPVFHILENHCIPYEVGHYKTYVFPSLPVEDASVSCFSNDDPRVEAFGFDGFAKQVYGVERADKLVSACVSTRENERCGEAWVFTASEYRRQGLAQKVVCAWARSLISAGKVPFYSHKIDNVASANLARSLKLQPVFEEISITHT